MNTGLAIASIIVSAVGSGAVVAALLYASRQARTLQDQLQLEGERTIEALRTRRAANDLALMGHVLGLDRLFVESPELRPHFYDSAPTPTEEPARSRVLATAELVVDLADAVASMIRHDQLTAEDTAAWEAALGEWGQSPAIREIIAFDQETGAWSRHTVDLLRASRPSKSTLAPTDRRLGRPQT